MTRTRRCAGPIAEKCGPDVASSARVDSGDQPTEAMSEHDSRGFETRGPIPTEPTDRLPTRAEIFARADTAFHAVSQTFLTEFETDGEPDLYPEVES